MNYKRFTDISEIKDENTRQSYSDFTYLNNMIESWIDREQLLEAYTDVLLWELDISNYTELHFQIKYLIDDVNVACNKIINFYDYKITPYKKLIIDFLDENNYIFPDNYRESFMEFLNNPEKRDYLILTLRWLDNNVEELIKIWPEDSQKVIYDKLLEFDKKGREISRHKREKNLENLLSSIFRK